MRCLGCVGKVNDLTIELGREQRRLHVYGARGAGSVAVAAVPC